MALGQNKTAQVNGETYKMNHLEYLNGYNTK